MINKHCASNCLFYAFLMGFWSDQSAIDRIIGWESDLMINWDFNTVELHFQQIYFFTYSHYSLNRGSRFSRYWYMRIHVPFCRSPLAAVKRFVCVWGHKSSMQEVVGQPFTELHTLITLHYLVTSIYVYFGFLAWSAVHSSVVCLLCIRQPQINEVPL